MVIKNSGVRKKLSSYRIARISNMGKVVALLLFGIVVAAILASCNHSKPVVAGSNCQAAEPGTIPSTKPGDFQMAAIMPQTGALAYLNEPMSRGVEFAVEEINQANKGINISLQFRDSGGSQEITSQAADSLISDNVDGIIAGTSSGESLSILDKVTQAEIVMISPLNTSPNLTTQDVRGYYFRTLASDLLQGRLIADLIVEDSFTSAVILNRADDYGRQLAKQIRLSLEEDGGEASVIEYDPDKSGFQGEAQKAKATNAQALVLIAFDEGLKMLPELIENNFGPSQTSYYLTDGLTISNLGERIDPENPGVVSGITSVVPGADERGDTTFTSRFKNRFPSVEGAFIVNSNDAVIVLALAALKAGTSDPSKYVCEINEVTRGGQRCTRFSECADLIAEGKDIDYDGASGPLEFTDDGEPSEAFFDVFKFNSDGIRVKIGGRLLN